MRLQFENVNTNKLHDELISNGINPSLVESKDNLTWITVENSQVNAVNAIVEAHDPTPILNSHPSLEERVGTVEVTTDEIVDVLATIVGV